MAIFNSYVKLPEGNVLGAPRKNLEDLVMGFSATQEQRVSFLPTSQKKGVLAFDSTLGKWCLYWNNQATYGCVDSYEGQGLRHDDWAALPVEDFSGVYLNAGVHERENVLKKRRLEYSPRPKPKLLTFTSEAPQKAPECKQLVPPWDSLGKNLPKDRSRHQRCDLSAGYDDPIVISPDNPNCPK
eukprot:s249_g18.t1